MTIVRRTFLLGLGAAIATPAIAKIAWAESIPKDMISIAKLDPRFKFRAISDIIFSSMGNPPSSVSVKYEFMRNDNCVMQMMMNSMATFRWVSIPGGEMHFMGKDLLKLKVDPCQTNCVLNIISNIEINQKERPKYFTENFHWTDGKLVLTDIAACNLLDQHLLES